MSALSFGYTPGRPRSHTRFKKLAKARHFMWGGLGAECPLWYTKTKEPYFGTQAKVHREQLEVKCLT
jgi:hypothetical protein